MSRMLWQTSLLKDIQMISLTILLIILTNLVIPKKLCQPSYRVYNQHNFRSFFNIMINFRQHSLMLESITHSQILANSNNNYFWPRASIFSNNWLHYLNNEQEEDLKIKVFKRWISVSLRAINWFLKFMLKFYVN